MADAARVLAPNEAGELLDVLIEAGELGKTDTDRVRILKELFATSDRVVLADVVATLFPESVSEVAAINFRGFKKRFNDLAEQAHVPIRLAFDARKPKGLERRAWFKGTPALDDRQAAKLVEATPAYDPRDYVPPVAVAFEAVTFPQDVARALEEAAPDAWRQLDADRQEFLCSLTCRLQPFVQVVGPTPVPHVIGFEALATTLQGEGFGQIAGAGRALGIPSELVHMAVFRVALRTANTLRELAEQEGFPNARRLLVSVNLDPEILRNRGFDPWLYHSSHLFFQGLAFEVSEKSAGTDLALLPKLGAAYGLRFVLDDVNEMSEEARTRLAPHAEMAKLDVREFQRLVEAAGQDPPETIRALSRFRLEGKPFLVEGVESHWQEQYLARHWDAKSLGSLFGQGYLFEPGEPWSRWLAPLPEGAARGFVLCRLPAPPLLARRTRRGDKELWPAELLEDVYATRYPPHVFQPPQVQTEEGAVE
ncbi:MAG: EAL domain-containing protein, partial [Gemmatimonadetes bacterium]|nr:EAL domain-containing protein [Gemmatimonadota bacterium]